jgi:hypothetical protein
MHICDAAICAVLRPDDLANKKPLPSGRGFCSLKIPLTLIKAIEVSSLSCGVNPAAQLAAPGEGGASAQQG